jgi:hypothetical protein
LHSGSGQQCRHSLGSSQRGDSRTSHAITLRERA